MPKIEENADQPERNKESQKFNIFCEQVAKTIGGEITPERVKKLVLLSNQGKHIFHGVKRVDYIAGIKKEGIKPLAPEGGFASFWTSGIRLFGELKKDGGLQTYDSSFFHYGHTENDAGSGMSIMTIAITNAQTINEISPTQAGDNDYLQLNFAVPREKIHLLQVTVRGKIQDKPREAAQVAEQEMFKLLENALNNGYELDGEELKEIAI